MIPAESLSRRIVLLATLSCLPACSTREAALEQPRGRIEGDLGILVAGPTGIEVHRKSPDGSAEPVARLGAIVFHDGTSRKELAISSWERMESGLRVAVDSPRDHDIELELLLSEDGSIDVDLRDRVDTFASIAGIGLTWLAISNEPADEIVLPLANTNRTRFVSPDDAFRSPLALYRSGRRAFAILPDLEHLGRDRPMPQWLGYGTATRDELSHTLGETGERDVAESGDSPAAIVIRRDTLRLRHRLFAFVGDEAETARRELLARMWREISRDRVAVGEDVLGRQSLVQLSSERELALQQSIESAAARGGADPLSSLEAGDRESGVRTVSFGARDNALNAALALELGGRRTGNEGWRRLAASITAACLSAPIRSGLFPAERLRHDDGTGIRWSNGATDSPHPEAFSTQGAALCGVHLIELGRITEDSSDRIRVVTSDLARFLRDNQSVDGSIASHFDGEFLRPLPPLGSAPLSATAAASLFLIEHAQWSGDRESQRAAQRALDYLVAHAARLRWFEDPDRPRVHRDRDAGTPCIDLVPLALAAQAAVRLAEFDPQRRGDARQLLDELHGLQQIWDPPWLSFRTFGGFAPTNREPGWNDPFASAAARALLDGYRLLGDRSDLERGIAALRASMVFSEVRSDLQALAAIAVAEHVRRELGDIVLDVDRQLAIAIENLRVARVAFAGSRIDLNIGSTIELPGPALLRMIGARAAPETLAINAQPQLGADRALTEGLPLQPIRLPRLAFAPPKSIAAGERWQPVATVSGRLPPAGSVFVVVDQRGGATLRLPMVPATDGAADRLVQDPLSEGLAWPIGTRFSARLVCQVDGFELTVPRGRGAAVEVGEWSRVDPGDDLELELQEGSPPSRVVRFQDGRENARRVDPGAHLEYWLDLPRDAAEIELRLRVAGATQVSNAETGEPLTAAEPDTRPGPRSVAIRLADARLWADGRLRLRIAPAGHEPLLLAHIDYRVVREGAVTVGPGVPAALTTPRTQIDILAIPWQVGTATAPAEETLRVALFGGEDYRTTPPPRPQPTAGSLARYVQRVSGGRTVVVGEVAEPISVDVDSDDSPDRGNQDALQPPAALLAMIDSILTQRSSPPAVILVVHDGTVAPGVDRLQSATAAGIPIRFVSERAPDGSYLSVGRLARVVLTAVFPMLDMAPVENGALGELALTSAGDVHAPPPPLANNLLVSGWLSAIDVERSNTPRAYRLASSLEGRSTLRLRDGAAPASASLLLENLTHSGEPGLLAMWELAEGSRPLCIRADGRSARVRFLRLSPSVPWAATPFEPATDVDLLRTTVLLDARSRPPLCTPEGDAAWSVRGIEFASTNIARLVTSFEGVDLTRADATWQRVGSAGAAPLATDGVERASGAVLHEPGRIEIRPRGDAVARGSFSLVGVRGPHRLRAVFAATEGGRARIRVALGDRELARFDLGTAERRLRIDYSPGSAADRLVVDCVALDGAPVVHVLQLLTVPRSGADGAIPLSNLPASTITLRDGSVHAGARRIALDARGENALRVPVVIPAGRSTLRLWIAGESSPPIRLSATLRPSERGRNDLVAFTHEIGIDRPTDVMLVEVPGGDVSSVAFLELVCHGEAGQEWHLLDASIIRG